MPKFQFKARDSQGRLHTDALEGAGPAAVAALLRRRGWIVLDVAPAAEATDALSLAARLNPANYLAPRSIDIELSCKQLAVMLRGGLTLLTGLQSLAKQTGRPSLRK